MATITTTPRPARSRDEARARIVHPLHSLRTYIRSYVVVEGTLVLFLYLALWFWIGLALDYGFFKLVGLFNFSWGDWVEILPQSFRAVVLGGLVLGLLAMVALKVIARLGREFRDRALALVLERRFPRLLGDRLITAVELADPRLANRYGFSQDMVDKTIRDAAEGVETLPIGQVFNWRRLVLQAVLLALLTVGLYTTIGIIYCVAGWRSPVDFVVRFHHVASIWFERNVLLQEVYWPRRAHLELLAPQFPDDPDSLYHSRTEPLPQVRVRAVKWVVADDSDLKQNRFGWRALTWADLEQRPRLLGAPLPSGIQPPGWPVNWTETWTVDQVDLQANSPAVDDIVDKGLPGASAYTAVREVLDRLGERADSPWMERTLRRLEIPSEVILYAKGTTIRDDVPMEARENNEFSGTFRANIRESIHFTVNAADFYTVSKEIVLAQPPRLARLMRDEYRPAYIYHRVPEGVPPEELKGKQHLFHNLDVSLGEDRPQIQVPAGTDLILTAEADKPLKNVRIEWRYSEPGGEDGKLRGKAAPKDEVHVLDPVTITDERSFRVRFEQVTRPILVDFQLTDTTRLLSRRQVQIEPLPDAAPIVEVQVEVLRRNNQGYLITASNLIPFSGKITDDHGLAQIQYVFTVTAVQSQPSGRQLVLGTVSALQYVASEGGPELGLPAYLFWLQSDMGQPQAPSKKPEQVRVPLATFAQLLRDKPADELPLAVLLPELGRGPSLPQFEDTVRDLSKAREQFQRLRQQLTGADSRTVKELDGQAEQVESSIAQGRAQLAEVYASMQRLHARLDPARVGLDRLNRLDRRVLGPLATILDRDVPACSQDLAACRESLQAGSADAGPAEQAVVKLDALLKNLGEVQYALLNTPRNGPIVEFRLDYDKNFDPEREPRGEGFDLTKHLARLKERDENKPQPHYLIQMWIEASDGNVEVPTPGVGASKETFTFQVVSENELLNDIAKEEEGLRVKLEEAVAMLQDDKLKLGQVAGEMQSLAGKKPDDYKAVTQLAEDTKDDVAKSGDKVREIFVDYKRILDQMRYARVRKQITSKVETGIVEPLDQALSQEFVQAQEALDDVVASLHGANPDPKTVDVAQEKLDLLIARLSKALESMKAVTTINMIIEKLVKIEKSLRAQNEILDQKYQKLYEILVNEATKPDKP